MKKPENNNNENPVVNDSKQEPKARCEQLLSQLIHELTNLVTGVIGYSELAFHAIEDSHPAREWLEKLRRQSIQLGSLVRKLMDLRQRP